MKCAPNERAAAAAALYTIALCHSKGAPSLTKVKKATAAAAAAGHIHTRTRTRTKRATSFFVRQPGSTSGRAHTFHCTNGDQWLVPLPLLVSTQSNWTRICELSLATKSTTATTQPANQSRNKERPSSLLVNLGTHNDDIIRTCTPFRWMVCGGRRGSLWRQSLLLAPPGFNGPHLNPCCTSSFVSPLPWTATTLQQHFFRLLEHPSSWWLDLK